MTFSDIETGIDIIETSRIRSALDRWGARFENRVFTEGERAYCKARGRPYLSYAGRFAAKEAAMKALGTGWNGVHWKEIEVIRPPGQRPTLHFNGRAQVRFEAMRGIGARLSISHTEEHAIAQVLLILG